MKSLYGSSGFLAYAAKHYDALPVEDTSEDTRRCYAALCRELRAQFEVLRSYVDVQFTETDPYETVTQMFADLERHQLRVFTGGEPLARTHALARVALPSGLTFNHIFRAVHDGLAHYPKRNDFTALGELRAFVAHAALLSPDAIRAIATETIGQQGYLRTFGDYAPQKFALLPSHVIVNAFITAEDLS